MKEIYTEEVRETVDTEIRRMAKRFGVTPDDVIVAAWPIAKDTVFAKLERDKKE